MFLTDAQKEQVEEAARSADIAGQEAEELVKQAFQAIFRGEADEAAYSVTEAAGAIWLTPDLYFKEKFQVRVDQARAILAQGKKDGIFEAPIPEDDKKAVSEASELVEMAEVAWAQLIRGPEVEIILKMAADDSVPAESEPEPSPEPTPQAETSPADSPEPDNSNLSTEVTPPDEVGPVEPWDGYDDEKISDIIKALNTARKEYEAEEYEALKADVLAYEHDNKNRKTIIGHLEAATKEDKEVRPDETKEVESPAEPSQQGTGTDVEKAPKPAPLTRDQRHFESDDPDYDNLILEADKALDEERIHKPNLPDEEIPDLPWDWTKMSDGELQKFHGVFSAIAYFKSYQVVRDERIALHCKAAADEMHNRLMVELDWYDEKGKEKKVTLVEAEISQDENVVKWRRRERKHSAYAAAHRNERDSLGKLVEALSRHETMRHQEYERSGQLGQRRK